MARPNKYTVNRAYWHENRVTNKGKRLLPAGTGSASPKKRGDTLYGMASAATGAAGGSTACPVPLVTEVYVERWREDSTTGGLCVRTVVRVSPANPLRI